MYVNSERNRNGKHLSRHSLDPLIWDISFFSSSSSVRLLTVALLDRVLCVSVLYKSKYVICLVRAPIRCGRVARNEWYEASRARAIQSMVIICMYSLKWIGQLWHRNWWLNCLVSIDCARRSAHAVSIICITSGIATIAIDDRSVNDVFYHFFCLVNGERSSPSCFRYAIGNVCGALHTENALTRFPITLHVERCISFVVVVGGGTVLH